jgi:hypothetical protein
MTKQYTYTLDSDQVDAIVLEDLMWSHQLQLKYITKPETREGESIHEIMDLYDALTKVLAYYMTTQEFNQYVAKCNEKIMESGETE